MERSTEPTLWAAIQFATRLVDNPSLQLARHMGSSKIRETIRAAVAYFEAPRITLELIIETGTNVLMIGRIFDAFDNLAGRVNHDDAAGNTKLLCVKYTEVPLLMYGCVHEAM